MLTFHRNAPKRVRPVGRQPPGRIDEVCGAFKTIVAGFSDESSAFFFDTVKRLYRLLPSRLRRGAGRRPVPR